MLLATTTHAVVRTFQRFFLRLFVACHMIQAGSCIGVVHPLCILLLGELLVDGQGFVVQAIVEVAIRKPL